MHIVIAALGSLVTILWLLHRLAEMGIDLGGLNPWLWRRRRKWRASFEGNPIYTITSPMELTALLVVATAKADGDMSFEEKEAILGMFEREFRLSDREAVSLLSASAHMLGAGDEVREDLTGVMAPGKGRFTESQSQSAIAMVEAIAAVGGHTTGIQAELVGQIRAELLPPSGTGDEWT